MSELILRRLEPVMRSGGPTSPFEKIEGFNDQWWEPGGALIFGASLERYSVVRQADNFEVARVIIRAERDGPFYGYGVPDSDRPFVEIQLIEVASGYRRRGYGAAAVELLIGAYPAANLIAGSESDEFWEALGWDRYESLSDPVFNRRQFVHWVEIAVTF